MTLSASKFYEALGLQEEPYGFFYTDQEPLGGFAPKLSPPVSRELEQAGKLDVKGLFSNFSCVIGKLWLARKMKTAAYFEAGRHGCFGGAFYLGFYKPVIDLIPCYISTGIPGTPIQGEHYFSTLDAAHGWVTKIDPQPAKAKYCVFKPLSQFTDDEQPILVTFFARGEMLSGLSNLAAFVTDDVEVVAAPFGSTCSFLVSWPLHYLAKGQLRAVLGCGDPSARKFLKTDEMPFTVPFELYQRFLARWEDSFLKTDTWETVLSKIKRSAQTWGE